MHSLTLDRRSERSAPNANEWASAIYMAVERGANIINISQGYALPPSTKRYMYSQLIDARSKGRHITVYDLFKWAAGSIAEAVYYAYNENVLVVVGAGNDDMRIYNWDYADFIDEASFVADIGKMNVIPASLEPALAVGGANRDQTDPQRRYTKRFVAAPNTQNGSNYGDAVDIYAPGAGLDISSYGPGTSAIARRLSGTSFASPIVAGVAALMKSRKSTLTVRDLKEYLTSKYTYTVQEPGGRQVPVVNAYRAVRDLSAINQPGNSQQAVQIGGRLESDVSGYPIFVRDTGERVYLQPYYGVQDPATRLELAGWFTNTPNLFHVVAVRNVPRPRYQILGYVGNATTGTNLSGMTVDLRTGIDACDGTVVASTQTDASGQYQFVDIDEGNYTVTVSSTGFVRVCSNVAVNAANPTGTGQTNVITTPTLPDNATRLVLVWGADPRDLDSHLTGPTVTGGRFHVFYANRAHTDSLGSASLDIDVTSGTGPETVTNTINTAQSGTYRFAIHDYSNRSSTSSTALSNSGAAVLVFRGDRLLMTLRPPANTTGTVWNVLEMEGSSGEIYPVNRLSFESDPQYVIQSQGGEFREIESLIKMVGSNK